jgi:hypothetical protein
MEKERRGMVFGVQVCVCAYYMSIDTFSTAMFFDTSIFDVQEGVGVVCNGAPGHLVSFNGFVGGILPSSTSLFYFAGNDNLPREEFLAQRIRKKKKNGLI